MHGGKSHQEAVLIAAHYTDIGPKLTVDDDDVMCIYIVAMYIGRDSKLDR